MVCGNIRVSLWQFVLFWLFGVSFGPFRSSFIVYHLLRIMGKGPS